METDSPVLQIDDVGTAQWNTGLSSGTDVVRMVWLASNEFALEPLAPGSLSGRVALVRRGGGIGFARKALAVRDAGAVGCIIYEGPGDRQRMGYVGSMGRRFLGQDFPDPGIPCALVGENRASQLILATQHGASARIGLDSSPGAMRRLPSDFREFGRNAAAGLPVHCAVLDWFEGPDIKSPLRPRLADLVVETGFPPRRSTSASATSRSEALPPTRMM